MTRFLRIFIVLLGSTALASAYTNILENGTNQLVDTGWTTTDITVGGDSESNGLGVFTSGRVTNQNTTVGGSTNGNFNIVNVKGDAQWVMSGDLVVGDAGSDNYFEISGGTVENADAFVGQTATASNNTVFVTGSESEWRVGGTLNIGGVSNVVAVADGGTISADDLTISTNGSGFYLNDGGTFELDNKLDVSTNGFNWNAGGHLALTGELTGMDVTNNAVYLSGGRDLTLNGGVWSNAQNDLIVGYEAEGSSLYVTNNGLVYVGEATLADVGAGATAGIIVGSTNGAEMVGDNSSLVETDGTIYLGGTNTAIFGSATVTNGSTVRAEKLVINDSSTFNLEKDGKLNITDKFNADAQTNLNWNSGGELEVNGNLTLDGGLTQEGRLLTLSGDSASWTNNGVITSGTNGTVTIEDGALAVNTSAGLVSGSTNSVVVTDSGSHWLNEGSLTVTGTANTVTVQNGGTITADSVNIASNNTFNLAQGGTLAITTNFNWSAMENLTWTGNLSVEGTLSGMETVTNVINGATHVATIIDGGRDLTLNGGTWSNGANDRIIGLNSSGSSVAFTNAATVVNEDGYIGWGTGGGNSVLVSGVTSIWHNTGGDLYVGAYWNDGTNLVSTSGDKNYLYVKDDAQVVVGEVTNAMPGVLVASSNGATFTVGNGSAFIDDTLTLGLSSNVTGAATVKSGGYLSVGDLVIADTNSVLDLQAGGTFDVRTNFNVAAQEASGFNWGSSSTLSVGGELTGMTNHLSKGQDLNLDGSNAVWNISGQELKIGFDDTSILSLLNGATLNSGSTIIGASTNTGSHRIIMTEGSLWDSNGDLYVGPNTDENYLQILSGSTNAMTGSASAYIGGTNSSGNYVEVDGSGSFWDVGGDLFVGNSSSNSTNNVFYVQNQANAEVGGSVTVYGGNSIVMSDGTNTVGGDYVVHSNAVVAGSGTVIFSDANAALKLMNGNSDNSISSGIIFEGAGNNTVDVTGGVFFVAGSNSNQYRNFQTLDMNDTLLFGSGTNDAFSVVNMTGGIIAPSDSLYGDIAGTLVINGDFSSSNTAYSAQVLGASGSDLLHFTGGAVDLTGMVAQVSIEQATNYTTTILTSDNGLLNNFASSNIVNNLLLFDADLEISGNDVNVVLTDGTEKFSSALDYAGTESVRAGFNGMKNAVFTRTKQLRRNLVSTAHSMPHEAFLMTSTNAPAGAQGPGRDNTIFDMHVWMQFFSGQGTYDTQGNSYGFGLNNGGTTIGADRLIGEDLTVGFNYTYARGDASTTNQDHLDTETYWFGAYSEWVSKSGLYVDALAAFGWSNYDSVRVEKNDSRDYYGTASYRGNDFGGYVDVGQYYYYKNLSLSPYAGLHVLTMKTDEHTESEQNGGSQINVHELSRNIVESALGMKGRYRFDTGIGRFQTTGFAEWTHDFVNEDIYSTLSATGFSGQYLPPVNMAAIKPDADILNAGLGLSWICTDYMEIGVGYNGRFSDSYEEHAGSLMLDVMF